MATCSDLAAKLLRDAATFFISIGEQNSALKDQMDQNATVYNEVADLLEENPQEELNMEK